MGVPLRRNSHCFVLAQARDHVPGCLLVCPHSPKPFPSGRLSQQRHLAVSWRRRGSSAEGDYARAASGGAEADRDDNPAGVCPTAGNPTTTPRQRYERRRGAMARPGWLRQLREDPGAATTAIESPIADVPGVGTARGVCAIKRPMRRSKRNPIRSLRQTTRIPSRG
jgi:hypothetical protein